MAQKQSVVNKKNQKRTENLEARKILKSRHKKHERRTFSSINK